MKRVTLTGFLIWAGATAALRIAGQYVFRVHPAVLLLVSLPLMIAVAAAVLQPFRGERRAVAAIALAAPGMLLDAFSAIWFASIFPNIPAGAAGTFGGWLLFCNVVVLLAAVRTAAAPADRSRTAS